MSKISAASMAIIKEKFVEIAHAIEEKVVGILILDAYVLLHHRSYFGIPYL
jgi:hypothetical protein